MPGDHGRLRNTAERWGMDDQMLRPPIGQDNAVSQEGAWRQNGTESAGLTGQLVPNRTESVREKEVAV